MIPLSVEAAMSILNAGVVRHNYLSLAFLNFAPKRVMLIHSLSELEFITPLEKVFKLVDLFVFFERLLVLNAR